MNPLKLPPTRYSCRVTYCHLEDKYGCHGICAAIAPKVNAEFLIKQIKAINSTEPAPNIAACDNEYDFWLLRIVLSSRKIGIFLLHTSSRRRRPWGGGGVVERRYAVLKMMPHLHLLAPLFLSYKSIFSDVPIPVARTSAEPSVESYAPFTFPMTTERSTSQSSWS